jgi:hypothetical protein
MKLLCCVVCKYTQLHNKVRDIYITVLAVRLLFLVAVSTNAIGFLYVASVKDRSDFVQSKLVSAQPANQIGCCRIV